MWNQIKLHFRQAKRMTLYFIAVSGISLMMPIAIFVFFRDSMGTAAGILYAFMLLLMCTVCFIEANTLGNKDRKSVSIYKRYPLKGFLLGFAAQFYIWVITFILICIKDLIMGPPLTLEFIRNAVNFLVLQYTDIMLLFDYSVIGYVISVLVLPIVCAVGYWLSYLNIDVDDMLGGIRK